MRSLFLVLLFPFFSFGLNEVDKAGFGTNLNYFTNPGWESGRGGWTASGGTYSVTTSTVVQFQRASALWDSNAAAQTLTSTQNIALDSNNGLKGQSGYLSCYIKVPSGTATHTLGLFVGTTRYEQTITSSADGARTNVYFPITTAASQSLNTIGFTSVAANEPEIIIDDCFLGQASGIGSVSAIGEWVNGGPIVITATTTNPTKATAISNDTVWYRKNGGNLDVRFEYRQNAATGSNAGSGDYLFAIPSASGCLIDGTKLQFSTTIGASSQADPGNQGNASAGVAAVNAGTGWVKAYNSTTVRLDVNVNSTTVHQAISSGHFSLTNANLSYGASFSVPCQGWSASQSAAAANQTDYGWTAYTPTFTGLGTVTSPECFHRRTKENLELRCKATAGTPTAVEARASLPTGLTSASTSLIPTIQGAGILYPGAGAAASYYVLIEPSVTYVTFSSQSAGAQSLAKGNGNAVFAASTPFYFSATLPISGWAENQRAPTLIGSVTSDSVSAFNQCYLAVDSIAGVPTIDKNYGSCVSSITDNTTGVSTVNFVAGKFSQAPVCNCTVYSTSGANVGFICHMETEPTTSSVQIVTVQTGVGDTDTGYQLTCTGPR